MGVVEGKIGYGDPRQGIYMDLVTLEDLVEGYQSLRYSC